MKSHHSLKEYIVRSYRRKSEPESMIVLAEVYWWMVLCIGGIITVGSGWFAFTFFSGTLKKIDIEKGGSAATTDKIVSIDPKKLHMMVTTVTHRDVSTIETLPAVSDPSL